VRLFVERLPKRPVGSWRRFDDWEAGFGLSGIAFSRPKAVFLKSSRAAAAWALSESS
jgi:hypothetical protein